MNEIHHFSNFLIKSYARLEEETTIPAFFNRVWINFSDIIRIPERWLLASTQSDASGCTQIRTQETHAIERLLFKFTFSLSLSRVQISRWNALRKKKKKINKTAKETSGFLSFSKIRFSISIQGRKFVTQSSNLSPPWKIYRYIYINLRIV